MNAGVNAFFDAAHNNYLLCLIEHANGPKTVYGFSELVFIRANYAFMYKGMTPHSFDQYCALIRHAEVSFVLTRREEQPWWLHHRQGPLMGIQFGSDGGASIADGRVTENAYILMGRHRPSWAEISINGEHLKPDEFVLMPPGCAFVFAADRPRTWFSLTLPRDMVESERALNPGLRAELRQGRSCRIPLTSGQTREIVSRSELIFACSSDGAPESLAVMAETELLQSVRSLLQSNAASCRSGLECHGQRANAVVSRALAALRPGDTVDGWYVEDLAEAAAVHPRTLLRAFHRVLGMGPVRYLRLRQLNIIRRLLNTATSDKVTVTRIMQSAGASDMGRVSGAYKALFGELPSETLRTALAAQRNPNAAVR